MRHAGPGQKRPEQIAKVNSGDHLSSDARSPHHVAAMFEHDIGIRFNDQERFNVEECCGWIKVPAGKTLDRQGHPLMIKLKGKVEAFYR